MLESLDDLEQQLKEKGAKLYYFHGKADEIVEECIKKLDISAIFVNRDYTPYSIHRDQMIEKVCQKHKIEFHSFDDLLLHPPEDTLKKDGKPYTIFTPYFRNASKEPVLLPVSNTASNYFKGSIPFAKKPSIKIEKNVVHRLIGGRSEALKVLKKLSSLHDYEKMRDIPAEDHSSHLSAYLKFNVCSVREIHAAICHHLSSRHPLIRSLYWRDFFTTIAFLFPHVFKGPFRSEYADLSWSNDTKLFHRWCEGMTGFPIVDAGMREMNATGFMHNRVRMIAGSFLVKDLHIDWRLGEKYFAQTLIDYDPAVNNGNWQWVASTGTDAQPYFRIFNPWTQQQKFDPDCIYIKRWIPELKDIDPKIIHHWYEKKAPTSYPAPITNHAQAAKKALQLYRS